MIEVLDNLQDRGIYVGVILSLFVIFVSGIFFGILYFVLDTTNTAFLSTDCVIENNSLVSSCQGLFTFALYPFLALKELLIWASFFLIFGLTIALLVLGYRSGNSPVLMGVLITFVGGITYLGILLSNTYRTLLEQEVFRAIMTDFTVYNKIMLYFPWFTFFIGLFAVMLGIINFQKTSINTPEGELNY